MDAFIGEIRAFCFNYPPNGWAYCNGAEFPVQQHQVLWAIIGYNYGGQHLVFNLPRLAGRAVMGWNASGGTPYATRIGQADGDAATRLYEQHAPPHTHVLSTYGGSIPDSQMSRGPVADSYIGRYEIENSPGFSDCYIKETPDTALSPASISVTGKGTPHENMQPYLALNYCICLEGAYPNYD
ncbi:microcystin-dependent protein [Ancylobacter aquaticus]|uniref:Microcystin-dependent protein n=1 Tax=Ancylobacter aquaticus TaxID=100 RepID=A0A4R1IC35_ANCAQ|nr:tail fiber protein [Ancylobacter aquaticus]TCK28072.1 microcystin-dependent protein [Ancylobacter aquaticus]